MHFTEEQHSGHTVKGEQGKSGMNLPPAPHEVLKFLPEAHSAIPQTSLHSPVSHLFLAWPTIPARTSHLCPAPANPTSLGPAFMLGSEQLPSKGCLCSTSVSSSARITSSEEKSRVKVLPEGLSRRLTLKDREEMDSGHTHCPWPMVQSNLIQEAQLLPASWPHLAEGTIGSRSSLDVI